MDKQTANTILMIEPVAFTYNTQTAVNNFFQQQTSDTSNSQMLALAEFQNMVKTLRENGIKVISVKDTLEPHTPDSIFPNNWITFHKDGRVALYPMFAENRRVERREDILDFLQKEGFNYNDILDYSQEEKSNKFLEGTGSMVLDRVNKIAYASLSPRTDKEVFLKFCKDFGYTAHHFTSYQTVDGERKIIYHTNVLMCVGDQYVIICLDAMDNAPEREAMEKSIRDLGKEIIAITEKQMHEFAGNMLQVENDKGERLLVMSDTAYNSLSQEQISAIQKFNRIIHVPIPTIETLGGGSARCMMAEVFLPLAK